MTNAWWYALKPKSWAKLLAPMVLGQAMGIEQAGRVSWTALAIGLAFTVADLVFVVLLNDYGDQRVDALKRKLYPQGCSPKTIPDGILTARSVRNVGLFAGAVAIAVAGCGEWLLQRSGLTLASMLCLGLFIAYTFPPLRLNYRGGGELLEAVGVGVALPWWNAYLQGGDPWLQDWALIAGFFLLATCSALGSGLADERSDAVGGKRTVVVWLGNKRTKLLVEILLVASALVWAAGSWWAHQPAAALALGPACLWVVGRWFSLHRLSAAAVTDAFRDLRRWKATLNDTISTSVGWISLAIVLHTLLITAGTGS